MLITIIGTGNVGGELGKVWAGHGHEIFFTTRDPHSEKVQQLLAAAGPTARAGTLEAGIQFSDLIVLAVPWAAVRETLTAIPDWSGKILVDTSNRMVSPDPDSAGAAAQDVARYASGARVVKAFNTIGANLMAQPAMGSQMASMFICGDDPGAKQTVTLLAAELGFAPVDCGPLSNAELLESLAKLWIYLARSSYGREIAFKLLMR